ncbi:IS4 family transposase [Nocardia miyunensis]|uniref:IS4 family transposase n=1 Tax=Nocardia miyunensis TaxID=282684 RepID=UPI0012F4D73B|nr:IS4 family transposase [Nocardia miyunensis]
MYFVLAMTLFFGDAYEEVMRKLADGLVFLRSWDDDWHMPSSAALCKARARLGEEPLRELFRRVAVPLAGPGTPGAWLAGRRMMAVDGVQMDVPDTEDNEEVFGRGKTHQSLDDPYPKVKVVALAECGTHTIVDAQIGAIETDERELARALLDGFCPEMLVIADRGFFSHEFWREATATGADLLWRVQSMVSLPVVQHLPDGSFLSRLADKAQRQRNRRNQARGTGTAPEGVPIRVIEYEIGNRGRDELGPIRLITTILDHEIAPAVELAAAYHHRWQIETSFAEIETSQRGSYRVLRSHSPAMVRQEIWGLLTTHYAIRELMYHAADFDSTDPLRLSFIRTLRVARRHITGQAGFSP